MRNHIYTVILTAVLTSFAFFVYFFFQIRAIVATDDHTLQQVVQFINSVQKQSQSPATASAAK